MKVGGEIGKIFLLSKNFGIISVDHRRCRWKYLLIYPPLEPHLQEEGGARGGAWGEAGSEGGGAWAVVQRSAHYWRSKSKSHPNSKQV
jgi:hypothetical protein